MERFPDINISSICFSDSNNGLAVGWSTTDWKNRILKTTDAGETWDIQTVDEYAALKSIQIIDSATAIAVGSVGEIIITKNFGKTWQRLISGTQNELKDVFFVNDKIGFAVGQNGCILKTTVGGSNWYIKNVGNNWFSSVYFINSEIGVVVGAGGVIYRTIDGGDNWKSVESPAIQNLFSVTFTDSLVGYAIDYNSKLIKTSNAGENWFVVNEKIDISLFNLYFLDRNIGYALGWSGKIFKTTDGGHNWISQSITTSSSLNSMCFTDENTAYITGNEIILKSTLNSGILDLDYEDNILVYPNPATNSFFIDLDDTYKNANLTIYNVNFEEMYYRKINENKIVINSNSWSSGIYFVKIISKNDVVIKKIMIK